MITVFVVALVGTAVVCYIRGYNRAEKVAATRYAVERESTQKANDQAILAAFADGKAQGIREATPKHGAHGRFVSKH